MSRCTRSDLCKLKQWGKGRVRYPRLPRRRGCESHGQACMCLGDDGGEYIGKDHGEEDMLTWESLKSEVHMNMQHGTCAQKRASMASAEASSPWPSNSACSMLTRARKFGLAMILFTASATPMWRWICGSALSAAAKSRSSARLRSPAYTSPIRVHSTQTSAPEHLV